MLFKSKTQGLIYDEGEKITTLTRVSSFKAPVSVEEVREVQNDDPEALKNALRGLFAKRASGLIQARCGIFSDQQFIRRTSLDPKRIKESGYLSDLVSTQFRIDPQTFSIATLDATEGIEYDATRPNASKDVVFCGLPEKAVADIQSRLISLGVYPLSLELSSLVSLGGFINHLRFTSNSKPTLVLEVGGQTTQTYIVSARGFEAARPIGVGLEGMVPVVQKELGLKDEDSARKLFFSNTFDFTGMGATLCRRLLKELQSSIGFFEVQTGQSIGQMACTSLPFKLMWLEGVIAAQLGIPVFRIDFQPWIAAHEISGGLNLNPLIEGRKLSTLALMMNLGRNTGDASTT